MGQDKDDGRAVALVCLRAGSAEWTLWASLTEATEAAATWPAGCRTGCCGVHTVLARAGGRWIVWTYPNATHETGGYERRRAAADTCRVLLARRAQRDTTRVG